MIKIIVATPKGELLNKDVESIVISGDTGQLGVLQNRLPLLTKITKGFVKVNSNDVQYVGIVNGVIDFKDNIETAFNIDKNQIEIILLKMFVHQHQKLCQMKF